jgi:hypothetical protein
MSSAFQAYKALHLLSNTHYNYGINRRADRLASRNAIFLIRWRDRSIFPLSAGRRDTQWLDADRQGSENSTVVCVGK